ncbi:hypothetical protein [Actinocorallia longicatena]|uniref:Uncharacterized protein n=1 Tax=Actinocorallia longicatena TaxID=111803 RepID=A0ABP6QDY2_9ACTN
MKPKARFTWLWIVWVALTLGIEGGALYRSRTAGTKDTLTAHTRRLLGIDPKRTDHHVGRLTFGAVLAWLLWHIAVAPAKPAPSSTDLTTRSTS